VTLRQALTKARKILGTNKDIEDLYLESEVLLRYILKIDRASLYIDTNRELDHQKEMEFIQMVKRRHLGEPLAYLIHNREFYKLDFYIDRRVLIPRPETELLVEEAIKLSQTHRTATIADIGTGSGAIAISLAVNLPGKKIFATDISSSALEVAKINCLKHQVEKQVILMEGDLLDPLPEPVDLLIANLPYVRHNQVSNILSAKFEPSQALDGGENGLDQIFRLFKQLRPKINPTGCVLMEVGLGQSQIVAKSLLDLFPSSIINILQDLAGIERVIKLNLTDN
jgi:release factor glutamine methyltransferase